MDLPIKNVDFPQLCKRLPEGKHPVTSDFSVPFGHQGFDLKPYIKLENGFLTHFGNCWHHLVFYPNFSGSSGNPTSISNCYHHDIMISLQCEAPKISKLVYNSNFTMVYGTYNFITIVPGAFVNQRSHHVWGPHIVQIDSFFGMFNPKNGG
jgi:hypothetical protein